jgi:hypothetical protein
MRGVVVLMVAFATGCAVQPIVRAPAPIAAEPEASTDLQTDDALARVDAARAAIGAATEATGPDEQPPLGWIAPESIHRARIEIARAALIDANAAKQQIDAAEQLERELETLMDRQRTAKGRPHRGAAAK